MKTYSCQVISRKTGSTGVGHQRSNGKLYAEGLFLHEGKNSMFNFTSRLEHFHPDSLHLTNKYEAPDISCTLNADFTGNNIDNLEGALRLTASPSRPSQTAFS